MIRGELIVEPGHRLYHLGRDPGPDPVTGQVRLGRNGGPVKVIPVGSVTAIAIDKGPDRPPFSQLRAARPGC